MEVDITSSDSNAISCSLPLILQTPFFKVKEEKENIGTLTKFPENNDKIKAQCLMCPTVISGNKRSTGNFCTHLRVSFFYYLLFTCIFCLE